MGIDVYIKWDHQSEEEREAQYTGFSNVHGHVGYLREAYHGGPYATQVLVPEGFVDYYEPTSIPSSTLLQRLPETLLTCKERFRVVYNKELNDDDPVLKSYTDFVHLYAKLEANGKNPKILVSA